MCHIRDGCHRRMPLRAITVTARVLVVVAATDRALGGRGRRYGRSPLPSPLAPWAATTDVARRYHASSHCSLEPQDTVVDVWLPLVPRAINAAAMPETLILGVWGFFYRRLGVRA